MIQPLSMDEDTLVKVLCTKNSQVSSSETLSIYYHETVRQRVSIIMKNNSINVLETVFLIMFYLQSNVLRCLRLKT